MAKHGANCNEFCLQMVSSMQEIEEDQSWPKHRLSKILNMILKQVSAYEYVHISLSLGQEWTVFWFQAASALLRSSLF